MANNLKNLSEILNEIATSRTIAMNPKKTLDNLFNAIDRRFRSDSSLKKALNDLNKVMMKGIEDDVLDVDYINYVNRKKIGENVSNLEDVFDNFKQSASFEYFPQKSIGIIKYEHLVESPYSCEDFENDLEIVVNFAITNQPLVFTDDDKEMFILVDDNLDSDVIVRIGNREKAVKSLKKKPQWVLYKEGRDRRYEIVRKLYNVKIIMCKIIREEIEKTILKYDETDLSYEKGSCCFTLPYYAGAKITTYD